ncbi:MAG TPA: glycerate kinase [Saprospiraceae bacterium]|nr:glycerate kinase [Saprospiraceae bacterium]
MDTHYLLCPDSFKDCLTSREICTAVEKGILQGDPQSIVTKVPIGDGGEGSLDALLVYIEGTQLIQVEVSDPLKRPIKAHYGMAGNTAYIEMAMASGLQLLQDDERKAMETTSFGTGQLIADALKKGANKIYLMVGGSATNDMGTGMAQALGYRFYSAGRLLHEGLSGKDLGGIDDFSFHNHWDWQSIKMSVICDVDNPLTGNEGATHFYSSQKGSTPDEREVMEIGMKQLASLIKGKSGLNISEIKGGGAAGGLAAGAVAFFNADLIRGTSFMMEATHLVEKIKMASVVISGEGRMDEQTWKGKLISHIAEVCRQYSKPLITICGKIEVHSAFLKVKGIERFYSLNERNIGRSYTPESTSKLLEAVGREIAEIYKL